MMIQTEVRPSTHIDLSTEEAIDLPPTCEALLRNGRTVPHSHAVVMVRFRSHGCGRDGKAVLLCAGCRDSIAKGGMVCAYCDKDPAEELFIVSSVALT